MFRTAYKQGAGATFILITVGNMFNIRDKKYLTKSDQHPTIYRLRHPKNPTKVKNFENNIFWLTVCNVKGLFYGLTWFIQLPLIITRFKLSNKYDNIFNHNHIMNLFIPLSLNSIRDFDGKIITTKSIIEKTIMEIIEE